ncbi:MAG TPA: DUF192 domain-containing protein [Kofleriaceae bacterium]|jgi:uncharacterized membrane protein (UPF0127 family)|nr:DUF192 domain-containing protein [Kofleriaceae bacterium]
MRRRTAVILVMMLGCSRSSEPTKKVSPPPPDSSAPPPSKGNPPPAQKPTASVTLDSAKGPQKVWVEVVQRQNEVRRGLMFREHLPEDQGMLFLMGEEKVQTFYMRNTLIPLDMIFITRDKTVAGIVENAVPLDETSRDCGKVSLYVLEVNGGWSKAHGVAAGAKVSFDAVGE